MSLNVWLGFRNKGSREPALRHALRRALMELGWTETSIEDCDLAVWWGMPPEHRSWLKKLNGKPYIVLEFPYWGRGNKHSYRNSMYKVSFNGLHPNDCFWQGDDETRAKRTGAPSLLSWRKSGDRILIAGMGVKGCDIYGYDYGSWDVMAATEMNKHTKRTIVYRPKPSYKIIPDFNVSVNFEQRQCCITSLMRNVHMVVTHHGNSAVDALVMGIPVLTNDGVGKLMGISDFSQIENPVFPENRKEFFNQLAWWQWSYAEIERGLPFKWLMSKGLING
jgi:hypothetical protein